MATSEPGHGLLGGQFTCLICGQEGLSEDNMRTHVLLEHVENNICCPFCDLSGIASDEMNVHINSVHFDEITSPPEGSPVKVKTERVEHPSKKENPDRFAEEHGGAIPKTKTSLKHSQSLEQSPGHSPSRKSNSMKMSQSESNISRRGRLQLNFEIINEPGPSHRDPAVTVRQSSSAHSMRLSTSSHTIPGSSSCETSQGSSSSPMDVDQSSPQAVRLRLQNSIHSQNDVIEEEGQDNNNAPLQPNLNQGMQPDINDNVEPDINSNMPAGFSCPLCQFITASENLIQTHVNMAHVDVLSPARAHSNTVENGTINSSSEPTCSELTITDIKEIPSDEYPCPICLKIYDNAGELSLHVNLAHSQIFSPDRVRAETDVGGFSEARAGSSPLFCPVCEMEFYEKSRLEAHVNGHFSAEQTPGKPFTLSSCLLHLQVYCFLLTSVTACM
mgnify:CR=1 FL=1